MPIIINNNFTNDIHGIRAERLNSIQGNFMTIQPELQAPANIVIWTSNCYDLFLEKLSTAGIEANEKEGAAIDVVTKGSIMQKEYQNARALGITGYHDDPVHLKDFCFNNPYPRRRNDQIARIELVLYTHQRHASEGITHLIPDVIITRLSNAKNDFVGAIRRQDEEKAESEHATAELAHQMESDGDMLRILKSWWFAMMGKADSRIEYIGMVNPKHRTFGAVPSAPVNLAYNSDIGTFSWDVVDRVTSYQLDYCAAGSDNNWVKAWSGKDRSIEFDPGAGNWNFRVRARNAAGYGDWSDAISVEIEGGIPAPDWVKA